MTLESPRQTRLIAGSGLAALALAMVASLLLAGGLPLAAELIRQSAGLPESANGFGRIQQMANAIREPILYAAIPIFSVVLVGALVAWIFGNRRALMYIGYGIGAIVLLAVSPGIIA